LDRDQRGVGDKNNEADEVNAIEEEGMKINAERRIKCKRMQNAIKHNNQIDLYQRIHRV